jgi:hypothetical protein
MNQVVITEHCYFLVKKLEVSDDNVHLKFLYIFFLVITASSILSVAGFIRDGCRTMVPELKLLYSDALR